MTLPTPYGPVKVDVLEVRQPELDHPSQITVTTPVAEPGPLIAMKLQAVMNRATAKQGTDLLDIVRLTLDPATRPAALTQIATVDARVAEDRTLHVDLWFASRRRQSLQRIHGAGGADFTPDDLDLVAELINGAARRA